MSKAKDKRHQNPSSMQTSPAHCIVDKKKKNPVQMNCRFHRDIWQNATHWAISANSSTSKTKVTMLKLIHIATFQSTTEVQKPSPRWDNLYLLLLIQCHTRYCVFFSLRLCLWLQASWEAVNHDQPARQRQHQWAVRERTGVCFAAKTYFNLKESLLFTVVHSYKLPSRKRKHNLLHVSIH